MQAEQFFSTICGPPLAANTSISKEIGVYHQNFAPYSVERTFKKSSAPPHCLAVSDTHVFVAQEQKAHVHVYSRAKGNQEAFVSFPERIRCISLSGDVLVVGTVEGRLIFWEICTGRQITTPACHVQPVSCLSVTPYHVLSGSDDANVNVWALSQVLGMDTQADLEPDLVLSNHRGAITDLATGPSTNPETNLCVSSSKDKTCIIWNYQSGQVLRTLLFTSPLSCISLDPTARAMAAATESGEIFKVDFFGDKPILGSSATEQASIVMQIDSPVGRIDEEVGATNCIALSLDGTYLLSGHAKGKMMRWTLRRGDYPTEIANLNASITNIEFVPRMPAQRPTRIHAVVKPNLTQRKYTHQCQLDGSLTGDSRFSRMLNAEGFPADELEGAISSFAQSSMSRNGPGEEPSRTDVSGDSDLLRATLNQLLAR